MTFRQQCKDILTKTGIISTKQLAKKVGCSMRTAQEVVQEHKNVFNEVENIAKLNKTVNKKEDKQPEFNIDFIADKPYYFDESADIYVLHLRSASFKKPLVIKGEKIRQMKRRYSDWDGQECTINEIARDFGLPRKFFHEIKTKLGWTHDSDPFTDEEMLERDEKGLVAEALENKKLSVYTKFEQEKWRKTKRDAEKWNEFEIGTLNPFNNIVATPIKYVPKKYKAKREKNVNKNRTLVLVLADSHCGAGIDSKKLLSGNSYDLEVYKNRMRQVSTTLKSKYSYDFKDIHILDLGESFDSNTSQTTDKGTRRLQSNTIEDVWTVATTANADLIHNLLNITTGNIIKHSVVGNHFSFGDFALESWLDATYGEFDDVKINPNSKIADSIVIGDSQFIITHGKGLTTASSNFSSKTETNVTTMLMQWFKNDFQNTKYRYVLAGHVHHKYMAEKSNFTFYSCPSIMGDDTYAESLFLVSRPAVTYFIVDDKEGIISQNYIYFK